MGLTVVRLERPVNWGRSRLTNRATCERRPFRHLAWSTKLSRFVPARLVFTIVGVTAGVVERVTSD